MMPERKKGKTTLLIVEDDPGMAKALEATFDKTENGYEVIGNVIRTGEEAIEEIIHKRPGAVILDLQLAGSMTGAEVAKELSRLGTDCAIVVLTGTDDKHMLKQMEKYCTAITFKPITKAKLLTIIEIALRRKTEQRVLKFMKAQQRSLKSRQKTLQYKATHDPLTNLSNRAGLEIKLRSALRRARRKDEPFALIRLDIDHFKIVNDTYGHECGDKAIRVLAGRIKSAISNEDVAARGGEHGDEFVILLKRVGKKQIQKRVKQVFRRISGDPITVIHMQKRIRIPLTVSMGVAVYPDHGSRRKVLWQLADDMLYEAKETGRNRFVIAPFEEPSKPPDGSAGDMQP